jgi:hypothetical protein
MPPTPQEMPLTVFAVLLLLLATVLFVLAAVLPVEVESNVNRFRLLAAGSACWVLYVLLQLIGGLVK